MKEDVYLVDKECRVKTSNSPVRLLHSTVVTFYDMGPCSRPSLRGHVKCQRGGGLSEPIGLLHRGVSKGRPPPGPAQIAGFIALVRWPCYLSMSVSWPLWGDLLCRNGQGSASSLLWGQIRVLITVVHPRLELPHSPPLLLRVSAVQQTGGSGPAAAQQD